MHNPQQSALPILQVALRRTWKRHTQISQLLLQGFLSQLPIYLSFRFLLYFDKQFASSALITRLNPIYRMIILHQCSLIQDKPLALLAQRAIAVVMGHSIAHIYIVTHSVSSFVIRFASFKSIPFFTSSIVLSRPSFL